MRNVQIVIIGNEIVTRATRLIELLG